MKNHPQQEPFAVPLVKIFQALAQPARLKIILAIGEGELCVCHLREILKSRQPYISQQLMVLRNAGLVEFRRDGRNLYYRLSDTRILPLIRQTADMLDEELPHIEIPQIDGCPAFIGHRQNQERVFENMEE